MGVNLVSLPETTFENSIVIVLCVLCIGLLGYLMTLLFNRLVRHLLRWRHLR